VNSSQPVAVKTANTAVRPVINEYLKPNIALRDRANIDTGVDGPVGPRFDLELEIRESFLGDQLGAETRAGRVLTADDRAVLNRPTTEARSRQRTWLRLPALQRDTVE
jgi:hypothetical protein